MFRYLITGATGFIGGHLAQACQSKGFAVSTIARPTSDTSFLQSLGVVIHRGELGDAETATKAVREADVVVHCAAKVGDLGPVDDYRTANVDAVRTLMGACRGRPIHRFVHMSSLGVYEPRHHYGTDETVPLCLDHLDGYTQSKAEAETLALQYHRQHGLPVVVLRPGFVYGPRDQTVLPRIIDRLRQNKVHLLGGGDRALNTIYVDNLVDAVFRAVDSPKAVGQVYNLTDGERVTKAQFFTGVAESMGLKAPHQRLPRWLAGLITRIIKRRIRRKGMHGNPRITAAQFKFLLLNLDFSIEKAKRELGYQPRVGFAEGLRQTMAWYKQNA
jgi:nucleoside-diphosphate-sugar epimerase